MAQDFDKIIKENLEAIFIPLTKKILAIETDIFEEIPDSVQETLEREPDFLKRVRHEDVSKDFILQIEFQTEHGAIIPARMLEYYGLLYKKYHLPVIQHIFYLRKPKWSVKNYVKHKNLDFSFGKYHAFALGYLPS